MAAPTPSDPELDTLIRARLALAGVDLNQLPDTSDPVTGTPSRAQVMDALRVFLAGRPQDGGRQGGTARTVSAWQPPAQRADPRLAGQDAVPSLYPSNTIGWTGDGTR